MAIQTQWNYDLDTEIQRIYVTFVKIFSTYFQQRDIPIVFAPVSKKRRNTVVIPPFDLEKLRIMRSLFDV